MPDPVVFIPVEGGHRIAAPDEVNDSTDVKPAPLAKPEADKPVTTKEQAR